MSLIRPFLEARAVLGVAPEDDAATIKRAYRKLALAHPPDSDPEGFQRVRAAYELLAEPHAQVEAMLLHREPLVEPPPLPPPLPPPPRGALSLLLLRLAAARADAAALLGSGAGAGAPATAPPPETTTERSPAR